MNPAVIIQNLLEALRESRCRCYLEEYPDLCEYCEIKRIAIEEAEKYLAL